MLHLKPLIATFDNLCNLLYSNILSCDEFLIKVMTYQQTEVVYPEPFVLRLNLPQPG